jgi:DNA polymerase-3 subunit epsilon
MQFVVLDTETTGLSQAKGHRIIEIALLTYELESKTLLSTWVKRFDPERPIDAGAQEVHGISYEDLVGCQKWDELADLISAKLSSVDFLVAHNMGFDGPFIGKELERVGVAVPKTKTLCTMEGARWACPNGKFPKLAEVAFALQVPYDTSLAHAAEYDCEVTAAVFFKGLERGFYKLPR